MKEKTTAEDLERDIKFNMMMATIITAVFMVGTPALLWLLWNFGARQIFNAPYIPLFNAYCLSIIIFIIASWFKGGKK